MYTTGARIIIAFESFVAPKRAVFVSLQCPRWLLASTEIDPPQARNYHAILEY